MPGDGPVLLRMPDIKLLNAMKITCEVIGDPYRKRKFDPQTVQASNVPNCKANKGQYIKTENTDVNDANANMQDYFMSSINRASRVLTYKIHIKFSNVLGGMASLKAHLAYR